MKNLLAISTQNASLLLRISLGVVLLWIGALKFVAPAPVVGLLDASFSFLASNAVVYVLGVFEILAALALFARIGIRYVGLLLMGLFTGTLAVFLIAPSVSYGDLGFPVLTLAGEFLLKDLVLLAATMTLVALETTTSDPTTQVAT